MALPRRTVSLDIGGGQMEAQDDWLVDAPVHLLCENVRFDARGALSKRYGHDPLLGAGKPNTDKGEPSTLVDAGGQLVILGPRGSYALDEQAGTWAEIGTHAPRVSEVLADSLVRVNQQIRNVQIATVGDVLCAVWEAYYSTVDYEVFYQFHDANTLAVLSGPTLLATIERNPKIVATSTHFLVYGNIAGGSIQGAVYAASLGTYTFPTPIAIGNTFAEVVPFGNEFLVMREAAGTTTFDLRDPNLVSLWAQATAQGFIGRAVCHNSLSGAFYAVSPTGQIARCNDDGLSAPTITAIWTPPTDLEVQRATIGRFDAAGNMVAILSGRGYDPSRTASNKSECGCSYATISTTPTNLSDDVLPTVVLAGHAHYLADTDDDVYDLIVPMALQCTDEELNAIGGYAQPGLRHSVGYLMRSIGTPTQFRFAEAGRFGVDKIDKTGDIHSGYDGDSAVRPDAFNLSRCVAMPNGFMSWGYSVRIENLYLSNGPHSRGSRRGGDIVRCRVTYARASRQATAQNVRILGNGHGASVLDSARHVEATPMRPPILQKDGFDQTLPQTFRDPGSTPEQRRFRIVHRWRDNKGNVYRGAPSPYEEFVAADYSSGNAVVDGYAARLMFLIPFPTALVESDGLTLDVELFHTGDIASGADSEAYYQAGTAIPQTDSTASPALAYPSTMATITIGFDNPAVGALAGADTRHYIQIFAGEGAPRAYFDEELLPAQLPPLLDIVSTQSRLWALSAEDRLTVRATTPLRANEGPRWPAELEYRVPAEGGENVGAAAVDDKVIIFKQRKIYVIVGEPADVLGDNETIQIPRLLSSDVGCTNPLSIVEGPFGVVFANERGIYRLSRDLELSFIGEPMKDSVKDKRFMSGTLVPEHSEVRWTLDTNLVGGFNNSALAVVWNYRVDTWSYWTSLPALHATSWKGKFTSLQQGAFTRQEATDWTNANFNMRVDTAWIKLAGVQGYQRIRRAHFLFRWYTGFVHVATYYDYDDTQREVEIWLEPALTALKSGFGDRVQLIKNPLVQKCESIKFSFREIATAEGQDIPTVGRGVELVRLDLEFGVKRGNMKRIASGGRK